MSIPRNLSFLAQGASSTGVLSVSYGGTGVATSTGSGSVVLSASPTFTGNVTFPGTGVWNSSGNVGIGTASPAASLSVTKQTTTLSGTGNAYGLYAYPTSSGLAYIDAVTSGSGNTSLGFRTYNNGTYNDAVRIDNSGNVGIGTSSPVNKVAVNGGISILPDYETYLVNSYYNGGWKYSANGFAWGIGNNFGGPSNGVSIATASVNASGAGAALTWNVRAAIDSSGNFQFNSGYGSAAVAYGCRAWLNYNLSTQTTRASANVSSVTYNSTGYITINFTNSMPDANYAVAGMGEWTSGSTSQTYPFVRNTTPPTTANCPIVVSSNGFQNPTWLMIQIVR